MTRREHQHRSEKFSIFDGLNEGQTKNEMLTAQLFEEEEPNHQNGLRLYRRPCRMPCVLLRRIAGICILVNSGCPKQPSCSS